MKNLVWVIVSILLIGLVNAESIFLSDYMEEGQTKVYEIDGGVYVINLLVVSDIKAKAVFRLNDEMSKGIKLKDSYVFKDGSEIVLRDLVINEAGDGSDTAYYYFYGTGEGLLNLKNVSMYAIEELCNFDRQCLNETKGDCCYDCGCGDEEKCVNNKCVDTGGKKKEEVKEAVEEGAEEGKVNVEEKEIEGSKEKKAARAMVGIILFFALAMGWFILKKKRRRNIF